MMSIKRWGQIATKGFYSVTGVMNWFGYITLTGIVIVVFIDVCGRYFFNSPLMGAFELVELGMTVLAGAAVMYCTLKWGHVSIDIVLTRFRKPVQILLQGIFSFLGFIVLAAMAYLIYLNALEMLRSGQVQGTLTISRGPFLIVLSVALLLSCVISLIQTFQYRDSLETMSREGGPKE
jgi:TRAP-type C4-dicarboxylate transport system permease small subunit